MSDNNEQVLPFFARYLEAQFCEDLSEAEMEAVQGGLRYAAPTQKHPPESPDVIAVTLKFPSDQEDGGTTSKLQDQYAVTKKYPSDSDEHIAVTQKYPSDGDDHIIAID